jgi:hypothetical protein
MDTEEMIHCMIMAKQTSVAEMDVHTTIEELFEAVLSM